MANPIEFRVRLGVDDWDEHVRVFRCSALAIPRAKVIAVQAADGTTSTRYFATSLAKRELEYLRDGPPPAEIIVTLQLDQALITRRKAGVSSGAVALITALITGLTEYLVAVGPQKNKADAADTAQLQPCASSTGSSAPVSAQGNANVGVANDHSNVTIDTGARTNAPHEK